MSLDRAYQDQDENFVFESSLLGVTLMILEQFFHNLIFKWNLVFMTHFIKYYYFTLRDPLGMVPGPKNQFYVEFK